MKDNNKTWAERWYAAHDRYARFIKRFREKLPSQGTVQDSRAYRWFGSTLLRPELWSFKADSVANGLALGLFVAFTPTMGFQMVLACVLILFFPGNLPVAIMACWITNPITGPAIYYGEYKIGQWAMDFVGSPAVRSIESAPAITDIYDVAGAMWVGSVIVGVIFAILGYAMVHGFVFVERKVRLGKLRHKRGKRPENGNGAQ